MDEFDHEGLGCGLLSVQYEVWSRTCVLRLPKMQCTDMTGAIEYVTKRWPEARRIETVSGDKPVSIYIRQQRRTDVAQLHQYHPVTEWMAYLAE